MRKAVDYNRLTRKQKLARISRLKYKYKDMSPREILRPFSWEPLRCQGEVAACGTHIHWTQWTIRNTLTLVAHYYLEMFDIPEEMSAVDWESRLDHIIADDRGLNRLLWSRH